MEIKYKILPPEMPNFLRIDTNNTVKKQDGFKEGLTISICDLTKEQAIEFAEIMKQEFINHWERKTIIKKADDRIESIKQRK